MRGDGLWCVCVCVCGKCENTYEICIYTESGIKYTKSSYDVIYVLSYDMISSLASLFNLKRQQS